MARDDRFQEHELGSIRSGLTEFGNGEVVFQHPIVATDALLHLWQLAEPLIADAYEPMLREAPVMPDYEVRPRTFRAPPPEPSWDLGLTHEFRKAVDNIDRKLQGRVLQALIYIGTKPTETKGDTVKPLGGEYKGLWRYRIGDHRVIYQPDGESRRVLVVTFVSRGDAYA